MSSRMVWPLGIPVLAIALTVGSPAHGASPIQDYVFDVPVNVTNVDPHFVKGTVTCEILAPSNRPHAEAGEKMTAGSGTASFNLSRGSYQGRVAVPVTILRVVPAMTFSCQVQIAIADGRGAIDCIPTRKPRPCMASGWAQIDQEELVGLVDGEVPLPGGDGPAKTGGETRSIRKGTAPELRKRP